MNLDRLILEVRPTGGVYEWRDTISAESMELPIIVHGGADAIEDFATSAPRLAYGTAALFVGLSDDDVATVQAVAGKTDFREWHGAPGVPEGAHCWIKSFYDGATYSTHLPYLLEAVRRTEGPVLELGAGEASTPALHELCASTGRLLVTVDNSVEWVEKFTYLMSDDHKFEHLVDPAETEWLEKDWAVVFVDHAPGESRRRAVARAKSRAAYVVLHDSEDLGYALEDLLNEFKYRKDFRRARPWTTVVSDTLEVWE